MKKLLVLALPLTLLLCSSSSGRECITKDGYCKGILLCGDVKIVSGSADFRVRVVESFPDLKVEVKTGSTRKPGEWRFVGSGEDFTIRIVEPSPDFTIKFVNSFPCVERPCND
ncbi:MAG: hypothetical protein MR215_02920 [Bacteroidales bacterium]|nr:hypothetical protein [Bacteroidales bacterium]MDD7724552.1 hypothetical protein [Bacteroidales bacterium]MDY4173856.1 hypothetical protein [Bacteroidales bacterium]